MMSDLLPQVPERESSDEDEPVENEVHVTTGEEGEVQVYEPPETKRYVSEAEVFPDMQVKAIAPVPPKKIKRKPSQKQLEHLARCRKLAAEKRQSKVKTPKVKHNATPVKYYTAQDMENFASDVLDRYSRTAPQAVAPPAPPPAAPAAAPPVVEKSQDDKNYEFWKQYF